MGVLTSVNFDGSFTTPHCQPYSSHCAPVKPSLRYIDALMGTIAAFCGDLALISAIIWSKFCWPLLCSIGVAGKYSSCLIFFFVHDFFYSCQGENNNLDGPLSALPRTRDYTEELISKYQLGMLWEKFGIISDVVVSQM